MNSRLVQQDPAFKKIADLLPQAVTEMKNAEAKLQKADPQGALEPEQKALQILQKAEEEYETQVDDGPPGWRRWRRRAERDGRGSGRPVRARARQDGEPVRDGAARPAAAGRSEDRRAARKTEGAGAASGAGSRAAAPARPGRAAAVGRRERSAARWPSRSRKPRDGWSSCRAKRIGPSSPNTARQLRRRRIGCARPRPTVSPERAQAAYALERLQEAQRRLQQSQSGARRTRRHRRAAAGGRDRARAAADRRGRAGARSTRARTDKRRSSS